MRPCCQLMDQLLFCCILDRAAAKQVFAGLIKSNLAVAMETESARPEILWITKLTMHLQRYLLLFL